MGLVESRGPKPSLRNKVGLGLFMGLRPMKEHVITNRDACSLSSLNERGSLDISSVTPRFPVRPDWWIRTESGV